MKVSDLTAVVLTKNEEAHIAACLDSLKWCDKVMVLDSLSADRTVEIARQHGAEVISRPFSNFADQRNAPLHLLETDWVFFVDADERVSAELAYEVKLAIQNPEVDGYWVPTRNLFLGQWLRYGGFWPDHHLRLGRKEKLHYDPRQKVHEHPVPIDRAGYLSNPLIHIAYQNLHDLLEAKARYATLLAEIHFENGLKPTYHFFAAPLLTFVDQLFIKQGYRDGWLGILLSLVWSYYAFDEYRKLWGMWRLAKQQEAYDTAERLYK